MAKLSLAIKLASTGMSFSRIWKLAKVAIWIKAEEMGLFWATKVVPQIPTDGKKVWG